MILNSDYKIYAQTPIPEYTDFSQVCDVESLANALHCI